MQLSASDTAKCSVIMGVKIIGGLQTVVDTGLMRIDELAGNVATKDDRISIARVTVSSPTEEPWLTLHYDEWICVLRGRMVMAVGDAGEIIEVKAGQTVMVEKGTRFQPRFPDGDTEYVPVCLPAFRPDRCIREEEGVSAVSTKLAALHATPAPPAPPAEVLYHMCEKKLWEEAKAAGGAYFPPTFDVDGFTHATAVPSRLITSQAPASPVSFPSSFFRPVVPPVGPRITFIRRVSATGSASPSSVLSSSRGAALSRATKRRCLWETSPSAATGARGFALTSSAASPLTPSTSSSRWSGTARSS